jgi:hypothetical protein
VLTQTPWQVVASLHPLPMRSLHTFATPWGPHPGVYPPPRLPPLPPTPPLVKYPPSCEGVEFHKPLAEADAREWKRGGWGDTGNGNGARASPWVIWRPATAAAAAASITMDEFRVPTLCCYGWWWWHTLSIHFPTGRYSWEGGWYGGGIWGG